MHENPRVCSIMAHYWGGIIEHLKVHARPFLYMSVCQIQLKISGVHNTDMVGGGQTVSDSCLLNQEIR